MKPLSILLQFCSIIHSLRAFSIVSVGRHNHVMSQVSNSASKVIMTDPQPAFNSLIYGANWIDLKVPASELRPNYTLIMGQCFNWKRIDDTDSEGTISSCWIGILDGHPLAIRQLDNTTLFANLLHKSTVKGAILATNVKIEGHSVKSDEALGQLLVDYFQTKYSLKNLYESWRHNCSRMEVVTETLQGVRVVRQDPFECLISFICSSNNNIKRIALMLDRLRCRYGRYVCTVRKSSPELSSGSLNGSHQGRGIWEVSIEEELGISMSMGLLSTLTQSPKSDFIDVKYEGEVETQETPKVSRGRAVEPKSPAPEVITVHHIYEFPSIEALALATEAELRALGMGYRAKFISGSAQFLASKVEGGNIWLQGLRDMSAAEELVPDSIVSVCIKDEKKGRAVVIKAESAAKSKLLQVGQVQLARRKKAYETLGSNRLYVQSQLMLMPGVGRKVADCVALFSLDQVESIPVDTHVWDIALRDYDPSLSLKGAKSITPVVYEEVGEVFRSRFPIKAGWAHSVLFAAELPEFRQRLPLYMQTEMKAFTEQMKSAKSVESNIKLEKRREKEEASDMDKITPLTSRKRKTAATTSNPTTPEAMSVRRTTKPSKSER